MDRTLEAKLVKQYPKLLLGFRSSPQTPLFFGVECGDGWFDIINGALRNIQEDYDKLTAKQQEGTYVVQIKEKFGGLRIYMSQQTDYMREIIQAAETLAYATCEECGATEKIAQADTRYIRTLCPEHMKEHNASYAS
jgi:hypothetical protein